MHQSGKGYKPFLRLWDSSKPRSEPLSTNGENWNSGEPSQEWPSYPNYSKSAMTTIQEVIKESRTTSKELQASLASIKVSVHDSTIRKRLGKNGIHGRVPRQNPLLIKKNTKSHLTFAKIYLDNPQDFWPNILWTDVTKVELLGRCVSNYIWRKTNTSFHIKRTSYQQSNVVVVW